jgi:proteasome accessory factor B
MFKGTELEEDVDNVFKKIEGTLDPKHYRMLARLDRLFIPAMKGVKDYTSHKTAAIIDTLANAILQGRSCQTSYHSFSDDQLKELRLDPLHFFEHNGGLYLFARALGRADVRMYALERFLSVEMTGDGYEYPKGFDPVRRLESTFTIFDEETPTTFRIRFSAGRAKYIAERRWAKGQKIEKEADGLIIFTMTTMGRWDVIRWLLSYGEEAELLEPKELRKEITEILRGALRTYEKQIPC